MSTDDPYIGVRIADGGYKLVAKIGEGGMGAVYRAIQEESGTEFAVKILHIKYALEREFVQRFKQEVKVLRQLQHPNTVRIVDDGEMDDGSLYIVMELLQGRGLDRALREDGPWPLDRAISMVLRVAYALEEAHRLGIVHRDMKPENIFRVELPKLLDFGLAKLNRAGDSGGLSLTQEGDILGTPAFMSPEQSFGESLDGRADIYSLAVILYELLTGHLPFEEGSSSNQIARYLNEPIPINERVEGLFFPSGLWDVMLRALQKLPEDRYSTAIEFAEAIQPFNSVQLSLAPPSLRMGAGPRPITNKGSGEQALPKPPRTPLPPRTPIPPAPKTPTPPAVRTPVPPAPRTPVPPMGRQPSPPSRARAPSYHSAPPPPFSQRRGLVATPSSRSGSEDVAAGRNRAIGIVIIIVVLVAAVLGFVLTRG